jgi:hypothetical protein
MVSATLQRTNAENIFVFKGSSAQCFFWLRDDESVAPLESRQKKQPLICGAAWIPDEIFLWQDGSYRPNNLSYSPLGRDFLDRKSCQAGLTSRCSAAELRFHVINAVIGI